MPDLRRRLRPIARRAAEAAGLRVLEGTFYDPVPDPAVVADDAVFARVSDLRGIAWDLDAQLGWAERELAAPIRGFGAGPAGGKARNGYYETGDAELAYGITRWLRPGRVVELGSGSSTLVLAHALTENGDGAALDAYNPFPAELLRAGVPGLDGQHAVPAEAVPDAVFAALGPGDLLFVDTSHTVKLAGDVNRVVLDVLPALAPGVVVHFHDIWLPHEYHPALVRELGLYWNEQYLLQAFLSGNPEWEVLLGTRAVATAHPERFAALIPGFAGQGLFPSSFWLRRRG